MSVALPPSASLPSSDGAVGGTPNDPFHWLGIDWRGIARPALALAIVVAAYRVSLTSLFETMRLDTPLAHLALVPFIALGLAAVSRHRDAGPAIHDRQLDWIVGAFLLVVALVANVVLPARLSTDFWIWRVDLLTMPLFVAGVVSLLFGVRTLWKYRHAVLFLLLAWPYPYNLVMDRWLGRFTQTTIWALDQVLRHIRLATKVAGSSSDFLVSKNGFDVKMSVASACSGANGVVGFLLVASAFLMVLTGSKKRKLIWLLAGATLVWSLNVVRIMIIFWAAGQWGERVAIDGFHPYVGLVVFNLAIIVMVLLLKPFGLKIEGGRQPRSPDDPTDPTARAPRGGPRPQAWGGLACVLIVALGVGVYNGQLHDYDRIANGLGSPRLADFATSQGAPIGWTLTKTDTYTQYERFFGEHSTWNRYAFQFSGGAAGASAGARAALTANIPITVDVIDTPDRAALNAYGIEQCYKFHGYSIHGQQSVDLGDGLVGGMLTWTSQETNLTWTTLYWYWPVDTPSGTVYERVTLVMNDQPTNTFTSPPLSTDGLRQLQLDLDSVLRGTSSAEDRARLVETRQFMIGFARQLVALRTPAPSA